MAWSSNLEEKATRKETGFTKGTTEEEQKYIRSRIEEAQRIKAAEAAGDGDDDGGSSDEEHAEDDIAELETLGWRLPGQRLPGQELPGQELPGQKL